MFDISFAELFFFAIVGLVVLGPSRLPQAARTLGLWLGRLRRMYTNIRTEIDREIGMDEVRQQLHNEKIMAEMKDIEKQANDLRKDVNSIADFTDEEFREKNEENAAQADSQSELAKRGP